ncbi:cell division protein FtsW [Thermovibrio guaymasensis]|uniref:Probable peptidoglycan glycosyltransferase FtsW n=1 Tax=Thermovibrio guaymasensis TaxID=240167 RepID=A0A420W9D9_9BACT|nr:FtsW/RodA/SpoVE family cell cycle protein [Thermovibrio guaymasensis]RKQ63882.1 cell division protein FtsW [Thermovibrio guaymasensis]
MDKRAAALSIFLISLVLSLAGVVFVYTGSYFWCLKHGLHPYSYALKQAVALGIGVTLSLLIYKKVDYRKVASEKFLWLLYGSANLFLLAVLFFGREINNSKSWIVIGGFSLQPAEFAKVLVILFVSGYIQYKWSDIQNDWRDFAKLMVLAFIPVILILLEKDLGSAMILSIVIFAILFITGLNLRYIVIPALFGLGLFTFAVVTAPYRIARIKILLDPEKYYYTSGKYSSYQLVQAFVAFASGGLTGMGIGQGVQSKFLFLTFAFSDFMFSHVAEEVGAVGALLVVIAYFGILFLGLSIADRSDEMVGKFMALGLTLYIFLEAVVHIGVNLGLVPTTGITLPFLSMGGSSLIANFLAVGFLMSIAKGLPSESKVKIRFKVRGKYA